MTHIYLDNASTTPICPAAIQSMQEVMTQHFGNPSSIHWHGRHVRSIIEDGRKTVANILKASVGEIFFTSSATEANNTVLQRAVTDHGITTIISSPIEHHCVLHSLDYLANKYNTKVVYLPVNGLGQIDLDQLEHLLQSLPKNEKSLVSLMQVNNEIATINPLAEISMLCQKYGSLFHTDAVQGIGKIDLDLSAIRVDYLTSSAHKFHGPKGVGFLYMNSESILQPLLFGGAQERNFRAGTENVIGIAGLQAALLDNINHLHNNQDHLKTVKSHFITSLLNQFEDIQINGGIGEHTANHILNVSFPDGPKADMLMFNLDISGISASSGSACSSGIEQDSHVLQAIGHDSKRKAIRFSFSPLTTTQEIDEVIERMKKFVAQK